MIPRGTWIKMLGDVRAESGGRLHVSPLLSPFSPPLLFRTSGQSVVKCSTRVARLFARSFAERKKEGENELCRFLIFIANSLRTKDICVYIAAFF